ncbi:hypothetical protein ACIQ9R_02425 [Streptomyces sp. NPDC094447]|uniref:hypothetical protein n=1 Tax=Streptomyces sp. NPDC094447 TaxID=3366062 RepID=UPI00381C9872
MQTSAAHAPQSVAAVGEPAPPPFLLSEERGRAARRLLGHVASLPLPGPEARLFAVMVTIRAARGGVGNVTGMDLNALRLSDPHEAVTALRSLGWQIADTVFDSGPAAPPTPVTVPELSTEDGHPLPLGRESRSRVSGWTAKTMSAKPLKKLPPAARLAALYLAAHGTAGRLAPLPADLPAACLPTLPALLEKGFLAELSDDSYRLDPRVGHLAGVRVPAEDDGAGAGDRSPAARRRFRFDADAWAGWKDAARPALRRHVESVEGCALCAFTVPAVAQAFTTSAPAGPAAPPALVRLRQWREAHPDPGPGAAAFTVDFRARHGHGPSFRQLGRGMGWKVSREVRGLVVEHLVRDGWLTGTGSVPWTLRPGHAAQEQGITLPAARAAETAETPAPRPS